MPKVKEEVKEMDEILEEEESDDKKMPFPTASIVRILRKNLREGKQIKKQVKDELNLWLGEMVEDLAKKMDKYPYASVDSVMLREALSPYQNIQEIEMEKERIIKQLESIKAACDVLISEVDRKFVK